MIGPRSTFAMNGRVLRLGAMVLACVGALVCSLPARAQGLFAPPPPPRESQATEPPVAAPVRVDDGSLRTAWDCNTETGFQPSVLRFGILPPPPLQSGSMV